LDRAGSAARLEADTNDEVARIFALRHQEFEAFVAAATTALTERAESAARQLLRAEGLLAVGDNILAADSASQAALTALAANDSEQAEQALKLLVVARFRCKAPLDEETISLMSTFSDVFAQRPERFWLEALAGRAAYQVAAMASDEPT